MRKFSDPELELAPQVAKIIGTHVIASTKGATMRMRPTIEDCLEWLREKFGDIDIRTCGGKRWYVDVDDRYDQTEYPVFLQAVGGDTLLEALYRVIISIGETK